MVRDRRAEVCKRGQGKGDWGVGGEAMRGKSTGKGDGGCVDVIAVCLYRCFRVQRDICVCERLGGLSVGVNRVDRSLNRLISCVQRQELFQWGRMEIWSLLLDNVLLASVRSLQIRMGSIHHGYR